MEHQYVEGFRQFFEVVDMYLKAPGAKVFGAAGCLMSAERCEVQGVLGACSPRKFLNRTLRNAVSSVSETQESVSQGRLEFTQILFESKLFNEIGQLVG